MLPKRKFPSLKEKLGKITLKKKIEKTAEPVKAKPGRKLKVKTSRKNGK